MPGYRAHLAGGGVTYGITMLFVGGLHQPISVVLAWLCCALIGSLFPDVDISSKGQKYFYRIVFVFLLGLFVMRQWFSVSLLSLILLVPAIMPHRGIFHRVWFLMLLTLLIGVAAMLYVPAYSWTVAYGLLFFFVGMLSHIILDKI